MALPAQILKTHLFNNAYQVIHDQFGDDPSDLIKEEGVNYEYNGKIWNIRIGFHKNDADEVLNVFIRAHSDTRIYGDQFSARPNDRSYHYEVNIHQGGCLSGFTGDDGNHKSIAINFQFIPILRGGVRRDDAETPLVPQKIIDRCTLFFKFCPELIPPHIDEPPPQNNNNCSSFTNVMAIVSGLALLYLGYKTIQETHHYFSGQSPSIRPLAKKVFYLAILSPIFYMSAPKPWQHRNP